MAPSPPRAPPPTSCGSVTRRAHHQSAWWNHLGGSTDIFSGRGGGNERAGGAGDYCGTQLHTFNRHHFFSRHIFYHRNCLYYLKLGLCSQLSLRLSYLPRWMQVLSGIMQLAAQQWRFHKSDRSTHKNRFMQREVCHLREIVAPKSQQLKFSQILLSKCCQEEKGALLLFSQNNTLGSKVDVGNLNWKKITKISKI